MIYTEVTTVTFRQDTQWTNSYLIVVPNAINKIKHNKETNRG